MGRFTPKSVGVEIALGDGVAELTGEAGVELVLGDGLEDLVVIVGARAVGIEGDVERLRGDGDLVDALPRHLEVGSARADDAELRVGVALLLLVGERFGDGVGEGRAVEALGAAEGGKDPRARSGRPCKSQSGSPAR